MKIMQILPRLDLGGVEKGVIDLVAYFKNSDIENVVVSSGGRFLDILKNLGISYYELPVHKKSPDVLFSIPKLKEIIEKEKIEIIHARSRIPALVSFFASRLAKTHFITTAHGIYKNKFFSEVMGWGKFVICPSKLTARHMRQNFGVPEEKIIIINRWIDVGKFTFIDYKERKNNNTIVSIGRIAPSKGYEYLILAFKKVLRQYPYLNLKIVGEAEESKVNYLRSLKDLVKKLSLDYNVEFAGFKDDIDSVLKSAFILVAPSIIPESFGRVIIEAFAAGLPVVAARTGAFTEIIDNEENGILVEPKSSEDLAMGILKILSDAKFAETISKKAREKAELFYSMEKCLKETEKVYRETLTLLRILVLKISSLGDIILALPSLKAIRERFPHAKIGILTLKKYSALLTDCPYVDEIITMDDCKFKHILSVTKTLRRKSFDYIIDFQNNRPSHIISFLSFPRYSFGYSLRWGFLLSNKLRYSRRDSPLTSQERILEIIGIRFKEKKLIFWEKKDDTLSSDKQNLLSDKIRINLPPNHNLIGINVSASSQWETKNWPITSIMNFIGLVYKNLFHYSIVLLGDNSAVGMAEKIETYVYPRPYNLCGKTSLCDLPRVIKKLAALITPDTATLHLSCALEVPTIALFGPTDPERHIVKSENLHVLFKKLPCSFCYSKNCKLVEKNLCMAEITPNEVFTLLKKIIIK